MSRSLQEVAGPRGTDAGCAADAEFATIASARAEPEGMPGPRRVMTEQRAATMAQALAGLETTLARERHTLMLRRLAAREEAGGDRRKSTGVDAFIQGYLDGGGGEADAASAASRVAGAAQEVVRPLGSRQKAVDFWAKQKLERIAGRMKVPLTSAPPPPP